MLIVGELINASRKVISDAIEAQDAEAIQKVAKGQREASINIFTQVPRCRTVDLFFQVHDLMSVFFEKPGDIQNSFH